MLPTRLFFALASRSGFGAAIFEAFARSSIVFCNSASADRIVVAASRLLGATAACIILSFAAEDRKSYWNGCDSDLSADFLNFGANNFPFKIPFKKCLKIVFLSLWRRDPVLELQFPTPLHVVLLCLQLSLCRSHCSGCVKVAWCSGCMRNIIVFCSWRS